jgi:predicted transcriptional regulator
MKTNEIIKKIRECLKIDQKELGKLLNISQSIISHYECGIREPSLIVCYKLINLAKSIQFEITLEMLKPEK